MNNNIYNPENIEAYLENKLSPSEKIRFENEVKKDPLLESEVTLQKDIVESLKNHRKAQLKNRLNNLDVSMSPDYFEIGAKIAASVLISGLVSFGVYTYFKDNSKETIPTLKTESNLTISNSEENTRNSTPTNPVITAESPVEVSKKSKAKEIRKSLNSENNKVAENTTKASEKKASEGYNKRIAPSMEENFDSNGDFKAEDNIIVPKGQIAQTTDNKSSVNVTFDSSTDKKFHYKYFSNKLFLYGNFDASTYEILELNTYNNKQVYLYYNNQYYKLNANQVEIVPLVKITDSETIGDLKKLTK